MKSAKKYTYRCYSLERMHSYINIEQEPKPSKQGIPPAYWPASGDLKVEKLSARYSLVRESPFLCPFPPSRISRGDQDGPKVLHDISFHIKSGERVGVGEY
jgi:ABC-type multidrug transport system fused ATPase/permease subunit